MGQSSINSNMMTNTSMESSAMPPYERLLADANQMSYQNTVAVYRDDGAWWLGNIQDLEGDLVFISFSSKKAAAGWIHARHVWPVPFLIDSHHWADNQWKNMPVYVALRDEDDGPFRFRPATLLGSVWGGDWLMFFVTTATPETNSDSAHRSTRTELVDECQVIRKMPVDEPPLQYRNDGLAYSKHFIPCVRAQEVLSDTSNKYRIIGYFRNAFDCHSAPGKHSEPCRFHLRIEEDGCTFITINAFANDPETAATATTAVTLSRLLETHLANRADLPVAAFSNSEGGLHEKYVEFDSWNSDAHVCYLPHPLLNEIFSHLDLHARMRIQRVCALWRILLTRKISHFSVSLESCIETLFDKCNWYKIALLLSRTFDSRTQSVVILNCIPGYHDLFLTDLLTVMGIKLPLLVLKNSVITQCASVPYLPDKLRRKHGATFQIGLLRNICERILLYNCTVAKVFGPPMYDVFVSNGMGFVPLPAHEREAMRFVAQTYDYMLDIDGLQITIPRLHFSCDKGWEHMASRFMWALDNNNPPITDDVYAKVAAVHTRWVDTLAYPEQWETVRSFLCMFSGFDMDGTPRQWDQVDLRDVNVKQFSRMVLLGISKAFL
ncbi:uncharacterized protein LOC129596870 [Paramacrobiotus metropolitanus]|uniref:uncharacterized protein LOC129596870 n=1 Tax=Paramacrobiotus metropolitanus TaxID=2943436 RepID=UPI002445A7AE|nr:uncharacterized protein LOC129596870 [Paramacrobiotus metropolitanus]